jgi:protein gp37
MYAWVTHTHSHIGGECQHKCVYCYVENLRFGRPAKYQGEIRLIEKELGVKYGRGKSIFIENCNDMFADSIPDSFIEEIINHCRKWPENTYIFQTKNPARLLQWIPKMEFKCVAGTTIETNRDTSPFSRAPAPFERKQAMAQIHDVRKFVTIEPIMDFDVDALLEWMIEIRPDFINIGADSKKCNLPEPSWAKCSKLIAGLKAQGIEVKMKSNLSRLQKCHEV